MRTVSAVVAGRVLPSPTAASNSARLNKALKPAVNKSPREWAMPKAAVVTVMSVLMSASGSRNSASPLP